MGLVVFSNLDSHACVDGFSGACRLCWQASGLVQQHVIVPRLAGWLIAMDTLQWWLLE